MREIKFRAWDNMGKTMIGIEQWLAIELSGAIDVLTPDWKYYRANKNGYILMQYTGLKDKNGKEIYEGDIVGRKKDHCYEIKFVDGRMTICFLNTKNPIAQEGLLWFYSNIDLEIFGNIYENPELLGKKYQIIYADPPWKYNDPKGNNPKLGGITYPTMTDKEIYVLPIKDITAENATLFLWATMPKLPEALITIEKWGFKYITCAFVWVKQNPSGNGIYSGLGHWVCGNAELVLLGKKGKPQRVSKKVKQIIIEPRSYHSKKPSKVRKRIVELMGDLPRIELFARKSKELFEDDSFKGWDVWGNEVESDIRI